MTSDQPRPVRRTVQVTPRRGKAFSLVEILIVVALLGILAAIVIPRFATASEAARASAAAATVKQVQSKINEYHQLHGAFPTGIDADWFAGGKGPRNPWRPELGSAVQAVDSDSANVHPRIKFITGDSSMWYNPSSGRFRMLVPLEGTNDDIVRTYNEANSAAVTNILQQTN